MPKSKADSDYVERAKTIANAAEEVAYMAAKAREMLEQVQRSKWWGLLTSTKNAGK